MKQKTVLITGGLGYIGSHIALQLIEEGYNVISIDNNPNHKNQEGIEKLTNEIYWNYDIDLSVGLNKKAVKEIITKNSVDYIIHCAALKSIPESRLIPYDYLSNNIQSTITVLDAVRECAHKIKKLILSSTCAVYGTPSSVPVGEYHHYSGFNNSYAYSKQMSELLVKSAGLKQYYILRYFNPVGVHKSLLLDKLSKTDIVSNMIHSVRNGKKFNIYGTDLNTPDHTAERDYIHILDLVDAHIKCLKDSRSGNGYTYNVSTGKPHSVKQMISLFEEATKQKLSITKKNQRPGEVDSIYANSYGIGLELKWNPNRSIKDAILSEWNFEIRKK